MENSDNDFDKTDNSDDSPEIDIEIDPIAEFLEALSPGQTIMVTRTRPSEYRGFLEEISITGDNSPIDIPALIKRWGGHQLTLRVRNRNGKLGAIYSIPLFTFPPLIYGQALEQVNPFEKQIQKSIELSQRQNSQFSSPQGQSLETLSALMAVLQNAQSSQMGMFKEILKRDQIPTQIQPVSQIDGIKDILQMFSMFQSMVTRSAVPDVSPSEFGELGSLIPIITQLLTGGNKKPTLTPPQYQAPKSVPSSNPSVSVIPQTTQPDIDELASLIAAAGPAASAAVAAKIFGSLKASDREAAIDSFCDLANIDIEDESIDEPKDNKNTA